MHLIFSGATEVDAGVRRTVGQTSAFVADGVFPDQDLYVDFSSFTIFPGFADVHVHLREPGFSYKETMESGTAAGAAGGYTDLCAMPNLAPVPDSADSLRQQLHRISEGACIRVRPYGAITRGEAGAELSDFDAMAPFVAGLSDDGRGVQSEELMLQAMRRARELGLIIAAHCEDNSLLHGGYIHDGAYAAAHGHRGICSESEYGPIRRDLELVRKTGVDYHICHVSTKESVELIRRAKAEGLPVTAETAPHYLLMDDTMLQEDGRFKMNPPLRGPEDREALLAGLLDGTIDMIATDHAPHSAEEKSRGLAGSLMGVVGLECAFPVLYTHLVLTGILSLERLVHLMSTAPRRRFSLPEARFGEGGSYTVYDLNRTYRIDPATFRSKGRSTPFAGWEVKGMCMMTVLDGKVVYMHPDVMKLRKETV